MKSSRFRNNFVFVGLAAILLLGPSLVGGAACAAQPDVSIVSANAKITQGVITCPGPPATSEVVSCFESGALSDAYTIGATLKLSSQSDFLTALETTGLGITLATGTTCAEFTSSGDVIPSGAFTITTPAVDVQQFFIFETASFEGSLVVEGFFGEDFPGVFADLNLQLNGLGQVIELSLEGNASLCDPTPTALILEWGTDEFACADISSPSLGTLNLDNGVVHGCAVSLSQ
jgi:hypothetical protein